MSFRSRTHRTTPASAGTRASSTTRSAPAADATPSLSPIRSRRTISRVLTPRIFRISVDVTSEREVVSKAAALFGQCPDQPVLELEILVELFDTHALVPSVRAHVVDVVEEAVDAERGD